MFTMNFACSLAAENYLGPYFSHFRSLYASQPSMPPICIQCCLCEVQFILVYFCLIIADYFWLLYIFDPFVANLVVLCHDNINIAHLGCSVFPFQDKWGPHSFQCALFPKGFPFKEGSGTLGDPSVNLGLLFCLRSPFSTFWRKNAKQQLWKPVSFVDHTRQLVVFDGQTLCLKVCFNSMSW